MSGVNGGNEDENGGKCFGAKIFCLESAQLLRSAVQHFAEH